MNKPQKLERLATLADTQQRDASQVLAHAIHQQRKHLKQLEELVVYRQDYARPLAAESSSTLTAANAKQLVAFLANLDNLIKTMERQNLELGNTVKRNEKTWYAAQQRAKSFDDLAQKRASIQQQQNEVRADLNMEDGWLARRFKRS